MAMAMKEVRKYPAHVGLIPDGNRRWAKENNVPVEIGYAKGIDTLDEIAKWALSNTPIKCLTVYGLSTENIARDADLLGTLFSLYEKKFLEIADDKLVHENEIKVQAIGCLELLPESVQKAVKYAEERTAGHDKKVLSVALGYGGREELIHAVKSIASKVSAGLDIDKIDEHLIKENLYTNGLPYPDLIIRTKERRLSNFLTWQSAYSELVFIDKYFPDVTIEDFQGALAEFGRREQRFGK